MAQADTEGRGCCQGHHGGSTRAGGITGRGSFWGKGLSQLLLPLQQGSRLLPTAPADQPTL